MAEKQSQIEMLKEELKKEIRQHQTAARLKGIISHLLFLCVIVASGLSLLNASQTFIKNPVALSALAIIPAIALGISRSFKFEARSRWNKLKQRKLEGLYGKLMYQDATANEVSKELALVLEELEKIRVLSEQPLISR